MTSKRDIARQTERRVFNLTNCEVRAADGDSPAVFSGYAAVFGELSVNLGGFRERIQPGAFRNAVEQGQDVRFLINHDSNLILGRTPATLTIAEDTVGLRVECELPNTTYANDLAESMRRGDINQMSFGFRTVADEWREKDPESGLPIRELLNADLFDVSAVTYPAYPDTSAEIRSEIEEQHPELLERAKQAAAEIESRETPETPDEGEERAGKMLSQKNFDAVTAASEILGEVLAAAEAGEITVGEADDILMTNTTGANDGRGETPETDEAETDEAGITVAGNGAVDIVRPDMRAFREWIEERGWGYDDDWSIWTLTQMIEAASCFLLYADDPNDDDAAEDAADVATMKSIATQLAALLAEVVAEAARAETPEGEERDETETSEETPEAEQRSRFAKERRRLALAELETELLVS